MTANGQNDGDATLPGDAVAERKASNGISGRIRRLGILELGWHAHEKAMPAALLNRMKAGDAITVPNIISVLARLSAQDPSVTSAYLCHSGVQYITKTKREGSFCGYRNIQMLISYILGSKTKGMEFFSEGIPSILELQDLIEEAWDRGFNSEGRVETGGIRRTRKHIGTPEVQALFKGLSVPCKVGRYNNHGNLKAFDSLLDYAEQHFTTGFTSGSEIKVHGTDAPPIYLQRPRHSLTIIGFEIRTDGKRNLLVLDPGLRPSPRVVHAAKAVEKSAALEKRISLMPYRRGRWHLGGYKQFETLTLGQQASR
jgi:hypothetical protein